MGIRGGLTNEHQSNNMACDRIGLRHIMDSNYLRTKNYIIMRRNTNRLGMLGAGFAMALAGLMGTAQAKGATLVTAQNVNEVAKTNYERKKAKEEININVDGGLDFPPLFNDFGMTPKQYGQQFGHGNKSGRSNRLRLSHNAKLKRRMK